MPRRQSLADPELVSWASHLPASFLACRDMGHSWRPSTASWDAKARLYRRELACQRCKTLRVQSLNSQGHIEATAYVYPDDYAKPAGTGAYDTAVRDLVRLTSVSRLVERAA